MVSKNKPEEVFETKEKIKGAASKLFAKNGFDGTSMRSIAKEAEVSLASINYHFKSKQDLYAEILVSAHTNMGKLLEQSINVEDDFYDAVQKIYSVCLANADRIRNTHSMLTSPNAFDEESLTEMRKTFTAPPGFKVLFEKASNILKNDTPFDIKFWVINNVILYVFNWIIWTHKDSLAGCIHTNYQIGETEISKMIRLHCEAIVNHANSMENPPKIAYIQNIEESVLTAKKEANE